MRITLDYQPHRKVPSFTRLAQPQPQSRTQGRALILSPKPQPQLHLQSAYLEDIEATGEMQMASEYHYNRRAAKKLAILVLCCPCVTLGYMVAGVYG